MQAVDAAGNAGPTSPVLAVTYDGDGPQLASVTIPSARVVGDTVVMSVRPTDAVAGVNGVATWDFGDGTATGNTVSHVYREPGTYHVSVTAADTLGNPTTLATRSITIAARGTRTPGRSAVVVRVKGVGAVRGQVTVRVT